MMRVTRSWVYAETRRDGLPHLRLGRYVRYRRSAIERWMEGVERGPGRRRPVGGENCELRALRGGQVGPVDAPLGPDG